MSEISEIIALQALEEASGSLEDTDVIHRGEYDNTLTYGKNNIVSYNGSSYINKVPSVGVNPTNTAYWGLMGGKGTQGDQGLKGLNFKGNYSGATTYSVDDVVVYLGSSYACIAVSLNNLPTNVTYFTRLVIGNTYKGTYNSGTTYLTNDYVVNATGDILYISIVDGNVGQVLTNTLKWTPTLSFSSVTTAEGLRVTAESGRVNAETSRTSAETTRIGNESSRGTNESTRQGNETGRVTAESSRVSVEGVRVSAETGRVNAESTRVSSETTRGTNESTRQSNETNRGTAESGRVSAESSRVTVESGRVTSEAARVGAESTRVTNETTRGTNETNRGTAETARVGAESTRVSSETNRNSNEGQRLTSESGRQFSESVRSTNETARIGRDNAFKLIEAYNPATAYVPLNKVTFGGQTYQCILNSTGNSPTNTTYFILVAAKGLDGTGAGTVLSVTSANSDIGVANTTDNPVLTLNAANSGANKILKLDGSGNASADILVDGTTNKAFTAAEKTKLASALTSVTTHASTHVTGGTDIIANAVSGGNSGLMSGTDKASLNTLAQYIGRQPYGVTTGTSTAFLLTPSPAITNLGASNGITIAVKFHTACGANPTLDVQGFGASPISVDSSGVAVAAGEIGTSHICLLTWDSNGSKWMIASNRAGLAKLASPAFTGTPTAPTASAGTNTTQVATTAFVADHIDDYITHIPYAVVTGSVNSYVATLSPTLAAYAAGVAISVNINITNTTTSTLNIDSLGAKTILDSKGNTMTAGKLLAGGIYTLRYNGTAFQLQGEGGDYGNVTASDVVTDVTFGTNFGLSTGLGISAKRYASGAISSTSSVLPFTLDAGTTSNFPYITVTNGFSFPNGVSALRIYKNSPNTTKALTTYGDSPYSSSLSRICVSASGVVNDIKLTSNAVITGSPATGFVMPVPTASTSYIWQAWEL